MSDDKGLGRVPQAEPGSREPSPSVPLVSAASGFDPSRVHVLTKYVVHCGSAGPARNPEFGNEADAVARYEEELAIPSYFGAGHRRYAAVYKITTTSELIRDGSAPAPLLCDTDGSPEGPDRNGLDGEAATAGAEGIAQAETPNPSPVQS